MCQSCAPGDSDEFQEDPCEPCTAAYPCVFCRGLNNPFEIPPFIPDDCFDKITGEMRRYLYRNVAAEYRKAFTDFHQMPDLPGWA